MATNMEAYDRIRTGIIAANLGIQNASTGEATARFIRLYHVFDDELDAMIAKALNKSSAKYSSLTAEMKGVSGELEDVIDHIKALVTAADTALTIATLLAKVIAIL